MGSFLGGGRGTFTFLQKNSFLDEKVYHRAPFSSGYKPRKKKKWRTSPVLSVACVASKAPQVLTYYDLIIITPSEPQNPSPY